ncbi:MAG: hypothetical protein A3C35_06955 [Omnitrophica bacterium RIFCSPHIGHO2_02_FULL_46_11]|nr:MAG: hypothetical protein A3A81_06895 [Omnitrophica bacterium RIFCSPLOWO2_01_FULL_45_10b]OGW87224.1 MAG: hypothetical protein A3C35_06955 [Omnitrophica bacterium RIFCSPHIGHO2_02_FULL_46_11]
MKLFLKKPRLEEIHTLDEKEIQKRLYGKYHRETQEKNQNKKTTVPASKIEFSNPLKPAPTPQVNESSTADKFGKLPRIFQSFPWKFSFLLTAALLVTVTSLQLLSFWFSKMKIPSARTRSKTISLPPARLSARPSVESPKPAAKKSETSVTNSPRTQTAAPAIPAIIAPSAPAQITPPKQRYYAVQVCTYQREEDAARLVTGLKDLNFPAFFRRTTSQQGMTHYEVFLSKDVTYAAANSRLGEFRKTHQSQEFPDSFIRSL